MCSSMVRRGTARRNCDCRPKTSATPMIHTNQGKTRSASVRPFHLLCLNIQ